MTDTTNTPRKRGRPAKNQSRVDTSARPRQRIPVHGSRDILTILSGKDPGHVYRFVKDVNEDGARIMRFRNAGYEFVRSDEENLQIGQNHVYKSSENGSIIVVKEGVGNLYLMKIKKEWYEEDQAAKEAALKDTERMITRKRNEDTDDGMYGQPKLSRQRLP